MVLTLIEVHAELKLTLISQLEKVYSSFIIIVLRLRSNRIDKKFEKYVTDIYLARK
jgi:hypothetical protein